MINSSSFFTDTFNTIDMVIGTFVQKAYSNLIQSNEAVITSLFILYIVILGYRFLTHTLDADLMTITRHLVVMLCVYGLIMSWDLYNTFVYNIFTNEPGDIAQVLVNSTGQISPGESIAQALDGIFSAIVQASKGYLAHASFSTTGMEFIFYAFLVFILGMVLCVIALLLFIYAKMALAIALALGPIFVTFILWESTRELFTAWLRKLITFALIPIVTSTILALLLSVIDVTLPQVSFPPEQAQFSGIAPFLVLSLAAGLILTQVFSICSALGGGMTLANISKGIQLAQHAFNKSGIPHAANLTQAGISKITNSIASRRAEAQKKNAEAAQNKKIDDFFRG